MRRALTGCVIAAAAGLAACSPSAYGDGFTGGVREQADSVDAALVAPRPLAPISVSFVATARPRFRWDKDDALDGAVVELSRTRTFDGDVKTFAAKGRELVVPEDLELGVWFWRLRGHAPGKAGTKTSPTWEVVVRGPAANGASDVASGSMLDLDGDGQPDLATTVSDELGPAALLFFSSHDLNRDYALFVPPVMPPDAQVLTEGPVSMAGGTDLDGDGYPELMFTGMYAAKAGSDFAIDVWYGAPEKALDITKEPVLLMPFGQTGIPSLGDGADVNGDGFGDVVIGAPEQGFVAFGDKLGPKGMMMPLSRGTTAPLAKGRAVLGAFDANADGLADVAVADLSPAPAIVGEGTHAASTSLTALDVPHTYASAPANAFATGDFDGDGLPDVAATVESPNGAAVCTWFGSRDEAHLLSGGNCVAGVDVDFGASLAAGDLEGDGRDELLVSAHSTTGYSVSVVHFDGRSTSLARIDAADGFGGHLTTMWPGRPGKARWAATSDDGIAIGIFEGTSRVQLIQAYVPDARNAAKQIGFGRGLR